MKESALEHHGPEIMKAILEEKKEPNPLKYFRPWERGDSLVWILLTPPPPKKNIKQF